ncbi:MAG: GNAT family N-acetyltransferase [Chitinophagales bacterium]|nr:GNAT family N-acetyltransferase [Chitinophagales bacterium]
MKIVSFSVSSKWYSQALALRHEVLRQPLGLEFTPAELEKDKSDMHFAIVENNEVLACLTLSAYNSQKVKMRQVAIKATRQRQGLGKKLATFAANKAQKNGYTTIFCHARKTAVPFYISMGYQIVSSEFLEVGIPHVVMETKL